MLSWVAQGQPHHFRSLERLSWETPRLTAGSLVPLLNLCRAAWLWPPVPWSQGGRGAPAWHCLAEAGKGSVAPGCCCPIDCSIPTCHQASALSRPSHFSDSCKKKKKKKGSLGTLPTDFLKGWRLLGKKPQNTHSTHCHLTSLIPVLSSA